MTDWLSGRPAEVVPAPDVPAPEGVRLVRLRLADRPGSLASVTQVFADHGVDVLRLEIVAQEAGWATDDFLVKGKRVREALRALGGADGVSVLSCREGVDLPDPGMAMAAACALVSFANSRRHALRQLVHAGLSLVFAEAAVVCVLADDALRPAAATVAGLPAAPGEQASLLLSALHSGQPLTADGRVPWTSLESWRERLPRGSVACVPGGPSLVLTLVRKDETPFVDAELLRLAALVRVTLGTLRMHDYRREPALA
jgi:ACT domain